MNSDNSQTMWRIGLTIPAENEDAFDLALALFCESIMWTVPDAQGLVSLNAYATEAPDEADILAAVARAAQAQGIDAPDVEIEELQPRNWVEENLKEFPPISQGRFYIYASHIAERALPGRIQMQVNPGAAFGTGTHATTSECLHAIEDLNTRRRFKKPLDVGTGSGILAMAMAKLWRVPVLGTDIDPVAIEVANENARINHVHPWLDLRVGAGFRPIKAADGTFDLIVANILARPLIAISKDVERHLSRDGVVVLSGLITEDEGRVIRAYERFGLKCTKRYRKDEWSALVLERR